MLDGDYDPCTIDNFHEAISEEVLYKSKEELEQYLNQRDFEKLGRLIWAKVTDYWEELAEKKADEDVANGYCDDDGF